MVVERALVAESRYHCRFRDRHAGPNMPASRPQTQLCEIGMWRESDHALEQTDELKCRQPHGTCEVVQQKAVVIPVPHQLSDFAEYVAILGGSLDAAAVPTVTLEQPTETVDQQFPLMERITSCFQVAMQ